MPVLSRAGAAAFALALILLATPVASVAQQAEGALGAQPASGTSLEDQVEGLKGAVTAIDNAVFTDDIEQARVLLDEAKSELHAIKREHGDTEPDVFILEERLAAIEEELSRR